MAKVNKKAKVVVVSAGMPRLAGGMGKVAAIQDAEATLRRLVMSCLLFERQAYQGGSEIANHIKAVIPHVEPRVVADIAIEARTIQKLRHTPLFIVREMARLDTHKHLVAATLPLIITRVDQMADFLALYWKDGKQPLSAQVKRGLRAIFPQFNEYQYAKYKGDGNEVKLRDVMFLVHPDPGGDYMNTKRDRKRGEPGDALFQRIAQNTLVTPDTWEVALSGGADKKVTWERLITERKIGGLAFLRNLRGMQEAGVSPEVVKEGFANLNGSWLLPLNFIAAYKYAPWWKDELEQAMFRCFGNMPKLNGLTAMIIDHSGSMQKTISDKSQFTRIEAAHAMAMLAAEVCERFHLYITSGTYPKGRGYGDSEHLSAYVPNARGFGLSDACLKVFNAQKMNGDGIYTRKALNWVRDQYTKNDVAVPWPNRIIVFSDSQDVDRADNRKPEPFGQHNYIVDVSSHTYGVNYEGVWTAEISGWSENFIHFISALEGNTFEEEIE